MRIILPLLITILVSCKSSKATCDAYSFRWNSDSDTIMLEKDGALFLPETPSLDSKAFHFSNPIEDGKYTIYVMNKGKIVEVQSLNIR